MTTATSRASFSRLCTGGARGARVALLTLACSVALGACSGTVFDTKRKTPPDEFAVVKRAPLVMPPDRSLPVPQPGMSRPQELEPTAQARALVVGSQAEQTPVSTAEAGLLRDAGAAGADPTIRSTVNRETAAMIDSSDTLANTILFWQKTDNAPIVDPAAEAERIAKARAEGRPVTEGETPVIRRSGTKALFGNLF